MADTKVSNFPPSAGLVLTDIFPVVDDPGGTPVAQKATFTQLATLLGTGNFVLKSGDTMTGALVHPDGTAALPSITFTGDLDTGIYHPANNNIYISVNGGTSSAIFNNNMFVFNNPLAVFSGALEVTANYAAFSGGTAIFGPLGTSTFDFHTMTMTGFDGNSDVFSFVTFDGASGGAVGVAGFIGFFNKAAAPVTQQTATDITTVIAALKAYGLLAP